MFDNTVQDDPVTSPVTLDLTPLDVALFWGRVNVGLPFECWPWTGRKNDKGYGRAHDTQAHRVAYQLVNGPLAGMEQVRHSCDNPPCCNPRHLLAGTAKDNAQDAIERGRFSRGRTNGNSKLTESQVVYIRDNPDHLSGSALALQFGLSKATISGIRNRKSWAHV